MYFLQHLVNIYRFNHKTYMVNNKTCGLSMPAKCQLADEQDYYLSVGLQNSQINSYQNDS